MARPCGDEHCAVSMRTSRRREMPSIGPLPAPFLPPIIRAMFNGGGWI